jgi:hypothetical protein
MAKGPAQQHKTSAKPPASKLDQIVTALRAPKGATIAQLVALTGWQPHSVRGAMSGALKKQRGLTISSTKSGDARTYKIGGAR